MGRPLQFAQILALYRRANTPKSDPETEEGITYRRGCDENGG
jgi:hypothetical protein